MAGTVLLTGATGFLGRHLLAEAARRGYGVAAVSRRPPAASGWIQADLAEEGRARRIAIETGPELIVHAAAEATIAGCDRDPARAWRVNVLATRELARAGADLGACFLFVSTDLVHDGKRPSYGPDAPASPLSLYGASKAAGEEAARAAGGRFAVVRLGLLFGRSPSGERGASDSLLAELARGGAPGLFADEFRCPLAADEAAAGLLDLASAPPGRVWNLAGPRRVSRWELGLLVAAAAGAEAARLRRVERCGAREHASRPADLRLRMEETLPFLGCPPAPPEVALKRIYGG